MIVPLNEYDFLRRALAVYGEQEAVVSGNLRFDENADAALNDGVGHSGAPFGRLVVKSNKLRV